MTNKGQVIYTTDADGTIHATAFEDDHAHKTEDGVLISPHAHEIDMGASLEYDPDKGRAVISPESKSSWRGKGRVLTEGEQAAYEIGKSNALSGAEESGGGAVADSVGSGRQSEGGGAIASSVGESQGVSSGGGQGASQGRGIS
jgi:hypothetical protein